MYSPSRRSYLWGHGFRSNFNAGPTMRTGYIGGSGYVVLITLLYPICWACSEGGNVISVTSEMVWYGVLDLMLGGDLRCALAISVQGTLLLIVL